MIQNKKNTAICYHCGDNCKANNIAIEDKFFCCNGCKIVYQLLSENNLCTYYNLNERAGIKIEDDIHKDKFAYLDNADVKQKIIQFKDNNNTHVTFYLPQIHCSSCLYLIENLHKISSGVISSKINFSKKEVFIIYNHQQTSLRNIVETLTKLGYEPHISLYSTEKKGLRISNSKIYKIGVAGFCFANIMLLSFPEYLSKKTYIEPNLKTLFTYLCLVLSLPAVFFSASEFYISAWKSIKHKYLNIDIPVVFAIIITFFRSLYEVFILNGNGYFDSLSGLVFFMLMGRIAQDKTQQYLSFERDYKSFFPIAVNKLFDSIFKPTSIEKIKEGDIIQIYSNELIPVDAILTKGIAQIDYSFVSGESLPVVKNIGDIVYAGGKQLNGNLELMVVKPMEQSYLTNLWNKNNYHTKKDKNKFIDELSKNFTTLVIILGISALIFWILKGKYAIGLTALTTILIVACPCTLLLASTFTYGNMMSILSKNKLYIRNYTVLENFNNINEIVFDKTGTITENNKIKINYIGNSLTKKEQQYFASLAAQSKHPYSKAILNYWKNVKIIDIKNIKEKIGKGIEAWHKEHYLKIGSPLFFAMNSSNQESIVYLGIDNKIVGHFIFCNTYREKINSVFNYLKTKFKLHILSGDNISEKKYLEQTLSSAVVLNFNQNPEDKLNYIKNLQQSGSSVMMFGDGLNDAGALKQSNVGIAITENNNNFTPACDAILDASQYAKIPVFFQFAQKGKKVITISFICSFLYNIIGLSYALTGSLSPLIAAILMPLSSISIIIITFCLTQYYAWKLNLLKNDKNHISS